MPSPSEAICQMHLNESAKLCRFRVGRRAGAGRGPAQRWSAGNSLPYEADCDAVSKPGSSHWARGYLGTQSSRQGRGGTQGHFQPGYRVCPWGSLGETPAPSKPGSVSTNPGWPDRARSPNQETVSL